MKTIAIADAQAKELRKYAVEILGIDGITNLTNRGQLIAKIEAVQPGTTTIQVADDVESPAQDQAVREAADHAAAVTAEAPKKLHEAGSKLLGMSAKQAAAHHHDPKIDIMIPQSPEPGGGRDVPVSINGVQFTIQRDQWVTVPYRVYENLKHAVETKYEPANAEGGKLTLNERNVYSYPFSTRNEPSEEDVAAWRLRTEAVELA